VPVLGVNSLIVMTNVMTTLHEIFTNSTVPPVPVHAEFGVCYVAFAGSHEIRYRGEKLLEVAARQLTAAATARGAKIPQCVVTDQPERTRPYVQLALSLRTSLDATPFLAKCGDYTALFKRPCKLLFGYMAKAIAAARPPYSTTVFVDTDTFVCNIEPLLAFPRRVTFVLSGGGMPAGFARLGFGSSAGRVLGACDTNCLTHDVPDARTTNMPGTPFPTRHPRCARQTLPNTAPPTLSDVAGLPAEYTAYMYT
jgi:hypothetical protein